MIGQVARPIQLEAPKRQPENRRLYLVPDPISTPTADKVTYGLIGSAMVVIGGVIGKWLGFLDGGRKHKLDQLKLALQQIEDQQTENTRIRNEHETKIAALEAKVDGLQNNLLASKGELERANFRLQTVQEALEVQRTHNIELQTKITVVETENRELKEKIARMRRRNTQTD